MFILISFLVSALFMNVYGMASDSIYFCYQIDKELNYGTTAQIPLIVANFAREKWWINTYL